MFQLSNAHLPPVLIAGKTIMVFSWRNASIHILPIKHQGLIYRRRTQACLETSISDLEASAQIPGVWGYSVDSQH